MMADVRTVAFVAGDVEQAGHHVRLRIEVESEDKAIDLRLPTAQLPSLVSLLLFLGSRVPSESAFDHLLGTTQAIPLPLRGASLGTSEKGDTLLMFEVGAAVLAFDLPAESMAEIGRALLAMSVPAAASAR